jgi:ATP-dependent DNA helicase RecG
LAQKANFPHKLIMSATPIPRTLALIIYGDLEITILKEMPHGRKPIETYAVTGKLRERIYKFIKSKIDEGSQAYIVCPMIEENENDINSVLSYAQNIENGFFKDYKIGVLHGQMNSVEKNLIMQNFKENNLNILVSTTVIEVGVDVPNAVVMMVESSDRFGLSQLHQLRGRVGRGDKSSYCVLVTDNPSEETTKRLKIMSTMLDGFEIAEQDLKLRGPGDFFGNKQHGLPKLKIADLLNDIEMINLTKELSGEIINIDENLMSEENKGLRFEVQRLFSKVSEESYN